MNENLSKFAALIIGLLFFTVAVGIVSNIDSKLKKVVSAREKENYMPANLSLKYSGISKMKKNIKQKVICY